MADVESPDTESLRLELKEAITGFNAQLSLIAQSLGFMIAADVVLLGWVRSKALCHTFAGQPDARDHVRGTY